jgi:hypothetical protein
MDRLDKLASDADKFMKEHPLLNLFSKGCSDHRQPAYELLQKMIEAIRRRK